MEEEFRCQQLAVLGLLFAAIPFCLLAQDATVAGTVTDSAQAFVPGVHIEVLNVDTGIVRTIQTGQEGSFTITNLPPGRYELIAEHPGFRTYRRSGLVLEIGQTVRGVIELALGPVLESVEVSAQNVAVLNTDNGAVKGDVIVQTEIMNLPLDGRDFTDLAFLVPGVLPNAEGATGGFASVNGARADSTNYYVDGFSALNARRGEASVRPNLGAIEEFRMEVSGLDASIGRMGGGSMNMVMRSGTNRYHGDIFEYVRNNVVDARSFFDQQKLKLNRHQFGATLHGPVQIPKLYDGHNKTFFMFSWESYRQLVGQTSISTVPTLLERQGDFSQSFGASGGAPLKVTDPLSKAQFPGNVIPTSRFHPIAVKLLAYYPLPNRANRNNYISALNDQDAFNSFIVKTDHRVNEKNSISYRYQFRFDDGSTPYQGNPLGGGFGQGTSGSSSLMGLDYTHLFSPSFLVQVRTGFSRNTRASNSIWDGIDATGQLGLPGPTEPDLFGFPRFNVNNFGPLGPGNALPQAARVTDIQSGFKFTWVKSSHVMKWGFDHTRTRYNQPYWNQNRGTYVFSGAWTSAPLADFLLGMMNQTQRQVGFNRNYIRATSMGGFFSDDFRATPRLTLNLGIRYEIDMNFHDRYNRMTNFVPALGKVVLAFDDPSVRSLIASANLQDHITYAAAAGLPPSLVYTDYTNFAPRAGFAWTPWKDRKTVMRGGYGIFYTGHLLNYVRNNLLNTFPYSQMETYNRVAARPDLVTLSDPFPAEIRVNGGANTTSGYQVDAPTGYLQSYNLTIERSQGGAVLELGYAGSKGTHLGHIRDVNLPRQSEASYKAGTTLANLRPYPYFDGTINFFSFGFNSIYNTGQISLRKRGAGGLFYRLNYSYSKSIDEASQLSLTSNGGLPGAAQDPNNRRLDRSRSDWDRGHVVTAAFSWQVPIGKGKRLFASARGWQQGAVGGWQLSGTSFFGTGAPITISTAGANANIGESLKPNRLATGTAREMAGRRRGVDYPWFDPAAFVKVPSCVSKTVGCPADEYGFRPFLYGNSGRNILDGPGRAYVNLAMMKNFRFHEQRNFQFRFESFNALNRPNFKLPNNAFNQPTAGLITDVVETGRGGSRVFQASLKFEF